jgi:hypothetical protein
VDDPPFQSESFRILVHIVGIFNPSSVLVPSFQRTSSRHNIFDKLGMSPNQPMSSHTPITSTSYTVPLDHFTGMTSNFATSSDPVVGWYSYNPSSPAHYLYHGATSYICFFWKYGNNSRSYWNATST